MSQLKSLKKRCSKQQLITRAERIAARKNGSQVTQNKDILYHRGITKTQQKELRNYFLGNE